MKDRFGNELKVGDKFVYPVKRYGAAELRVCEIFYFGPRTYRDRWSGEKTVRQVMGFKTWIQKWDWEARKRVPTPVNRYFDIDTNENIVKIVG